MRIQRVHFHRPGRTTGGERGAVMFVAIIVLLIMTVAGVALMRQMRGDLSIAGNLAFKQGATAAADRGTEAARAWLMPLSPAALQNDAASDGYFSSYSADVEPAKLPWDKAKLAALDDAGNRVDYLIHRLCSLSGKAVDDAGQECVTTPEITDGMSNKALEAYPGAAAPEERPHFRVTTRVQGPRNTLSYVQVVMY